VESITKATMTRGALIYAFNNTSVDYWKQAVWCADRVNRFLDIPVTIVTDSESMAGRTTDHNIVLAQAESGGFRVYNPTTDPHGVSWFNGNRYQSNDITPYDETLVIDSDYVVASDQLNILFDSGLDVAVIKDVYDITDRESFRDYLTVNAARVGLHHYWATVMFFKRTSVARDFFALLSMVRKNYRHYSNLYRFPSSPYRNDFAVSIAMTTLFGHVPQAVKSIPWRMANAGSDVEIAELGQDQFELSYRCYDTERLKRITVSGVDFHFMNKKSLSNLYATTG
jgi:hypothetical protein